MEAVAAHAALGDSRGSANAWATSGCTRWNAVSKQATCGSSGRVRRSADRRQVVRLVQRRQRHELFELREHRGVDQRGTA